MRARMQVTLEVPLDTEVPEMEMVPVAEGLRAEYGKNEKEVLAARKRAAKDAEKAAKELKEKFKADEVLVLEVIDG